MVLRYFLKKIQCNSNHLYKNYTVQTEYIFFLEILGAKVIFSENVRFMSMLTFIRENYHSRQIFDDQIIKYSPS